MNIHSSKCLYNIIDGTQAKKNSIYCNQKVKFIFQVCLKNEKTEMVSKLLTNGWTLWQLNNMFKR